MAKLVAESKNVAPGGGDGLLSGVDQVGVLVAFKREGAHAQHAVFTLEFDGNAFGNVVGRKVGMQYPGLRRSRPGALVRCVSRCLVYPALFTFFRRSAAGAYRALFNAFLVALPSKMRWTKMPGVWISRSSSPRAPILHLSDGNGAGHGHHGVEVARGALKDQVTGLVAFPGLDDGVICGQGFQGYAACR